MELGYKVHKKHRVAKPTLDASVWRVSEWDEMALFVCAGSSGWASMSDKKRYLWAILEKMSILGQGLEKSGKEVDLHIAKFVNDDNMWHGYPVQARGDDIPPESILDIWLGSEMINKAQKIKIIGGKFR